MSNSCTEQVKDQKEQVATFVSTNVRRNENLIVDSIENRTKMEAATAEKKQPPKQKTKVITHKNFDCTPSRKTPNKRQATNDDIGLNMNEPLGSDSFHIFVYSFIHNILRYHATLMGPHI